MKQSKNYKKLIEFAKHGKSRRLLNNLQKKDTGLLKDELDAILNLYRDTGLDIEVHHLINRRGILSEQQYMALAQKVRESCRSESFEEFCIRLKELLSCGMTMNPTKMEPEE